MGNYYYASIRVMGGITQEQFTALMEHVSNTSAIGEEGPHSKEEIMLAVMEKSLAWSDSNARDGMFEDFEQFLKDQKIPFKRYSSNYQEYDGCYTVFDGKRQRGFTCDSNGHMTLRVDEIKERVKNRRFKQWLDIYSRKANGPGGFHIIGAPVVKKKKRVVRA